MERFRDGLAGMVGSQHGRWLINRSRIANVVDAAVARTLSDDLLERRTLEIEGPRSAGEATLGIKVKKSGRTTWLTHSQITQWMQWYGCAMVRTG